MSTAARPQLPHGREPLNEHRLARGCYLCWLTAVLQTAPHVMPNANLKFQLDDLLEMVSTCLACTLVCAFAVPCLSAWQPASAGTYCPDGLVGCCVQVTPILRDTLRQEAFDHFLTSTAGEFCGCMLTLDGHVKVRRPRCSTQLQPTDAPDRFATSNARRLVVAPYCDGTPVRGDALGRCARCIAKCLRPRAVPGQLFWLCCLT